MENVLLVITIVSVALTVGLALALASVMGDERRRSEARVGLLRDLSAQAAPPQRSAPVRPAPVAIEPIRLAPLPPAAAPAPAAAPGRVTAVPDLEIRPSGAVAGVATLFHAPERPSPWPRRAVVIAGMAAVVLVAVMAGRLRAPAAPPAAVRTETPAVAVPPAAAPKPLELLSLNHTRQDATLTISGLVQNPRGATPLVHVTATALVLGPGGAFLTTGRAPLDFSSVGPGEESPFVITVPVTGAVERYRIAFRGEDGQVLAHVDRRGPDAVARR